MARHPRLSVGPSPLLDILSYGRAGQSTGELTHEQIEYIRRTVHRAPEVMVKVLNQGATNLKAVAGHFNYLARNGEIDIETDDGQQVKGKEVAEALIEDWNLDLDERGTRFDPWPTTSGRRPPPRLVHKLILSMPEGTAPERVLAAIRDFAREEFGAKHRYGAGPSHG